MYTCNVYIIFVSMQLAASQQREETMKPPGEGKTYCFILVYKCFDPAFNIPLENSLFYGNNTTIRFLHRNQCRWA